MSTVSSKFVRDSLLGFSNLLRFLFSSSLIHCIPSVFGIFVYSEEKSIVPIILCGVPMSSQDVCLVLRRLIR